MKNLALGTVSAIIVILFLTLIINIGSRHAHAEELANNLTEAMESTANSVLKEKSYTIQDNDEFIADFIQTFMNQMESDSDITINVVTADYEKGIIAVDVQQEFKYTNGKTGTVSCQKTIILDQELTEEPFIKSVTFYLSKEDMENQENPYKIYKFEEGELAKTPVNPNDPTDQERTFKYWSDADGNHYSSFSGEITTDQAYYAVFE